MKCKYGRMMAMMPSDDGTTPIVFLCYAQKNMPRVYMYYSDCTVEGEGYDI